MAGAVTARSDKHAPARAVTQTCGSRKTVASSGGLTPAPLALGTPKVPARNVLEEEVVEPPDGRSSRRGH